MLVVGSKWTFSLEAYPAEPPVNTVGYRCVVHLIEGGEERVGVHVGVLPSIVHL